MSDWGTWRASNMANDVARVVRNEIANYFNQKATYTPLPVSASTSDELMGEESTTTSGKL